MKIIENGITKKNGMVYRTRCSKCNCLFEFEETEVRRIHAPVTEHEEISSSYNITEYLYCPYCKKAMGVENRIQYVFNE